MNVRELLQNLLDHALDGRGAEETVLIRCDGQLRTVSGIETRVAETGSDERPNLFILIVADGPSDTQETSATTTRAPRL